MHPRDVHRMTKLLQNLRNKGNTVLVVEHDKDVISIADQVIDCLLYTSSFAVSLLLMLCILLIPALQSAFRLTLLGGTEWLIVIALSLLSIVQVEIVKAVKRLKAH